MKEVLIWRVETSQGDNGQNLLFDVLPGYLVETLQCIHGLENNQGGGNHFLFAAFNTQ